MFSATGLWWLVVGFALTMVPLLTVGAFARAVLRLDYTVLSGVLAGAVTNPSALAFATAVARSESPTISHATVYPLTMLLRILAAQVSTLVPYR